ncbi:MAG: hypothetical protein RH859_04405 [Longimicrobiales bacterium]
MPELGVVPHAVAVAADVDDMAGVQEAVDEGGGHDVVAEDLAPLLEALVGGEHGGGGLVAPCHELEEEHGAVAGDGQIADLVHDEQGRVGQRLETMAELARGLGLLEGGDEVGEGAVVDAPTVLGRGDGQADGQVGLPDAGRAEKAARLWPRVVERVAAADADFQERVGAGVQESLEKRRRPLAKGVGTEAPGQRRKRASELFSIFAVPATLSPPTNTTR